MGTIMGINIAAVEFKKILGTEGLRKKIKSMNAKNIWHE